MKPKFIEVIKLGVLVAFVCLAVAVVIQGPGDAQSVVHSFNASADGVAGPVQTALLLMKWFAYAVILTVFSCAVCLLLNALGVLTAIGEKLVGGLAWAVGTIRSKWDPPPVPLDTVAGHTRSGGAVTLKKVLDSYGEELRLHRAEIRGLKELTAGLEPPPPPKTADQIAAEKDAEIAKMAEAMARLRKDLDMARSAAVTNQGVQP